MFPLELCKTFGWRIYGLPRTFKRVSINSKTVEGGDLFVPLKGQKFDGHSFIEEAVKKGAAGFLFEKNKLSKSLLKSLTRKAFALEVDNTYEALRKIARLRRDKFKGREIIAITGTAGKTTTKELLAHLLGATGRVYKTEGNLNSQVGVPLTVANADPYADFWVLELGASERGNIKRSVDLTVPHFAVLTALGRAHLEGFKTFDNLILAKGEIFLSKELRRAVLPKKVLELYLHLLEGKEIFPFGGLPKHRFTKEGKTVIELEGETFEANLLGEGIVNSVLIALNVLKALNLPYKVLLKELLSTFKGEKGRMQPLLRGDYLVIDDSYNANPLSMEKALKTLVRVEGYHRRVAILGDMLELGPYEVEEHIKLGRLLEKLPIDVVYLYGNLTKYTCKALKGKPCFWSDDKGKLLKVLRQKEPQKGTVYLVKGSRGSKMEEVLEIL